MAYASQMLTSPDLRLPHITLPKLRRPHVSARARAVLVMGLMISPAYLADYIGYGIKRLSYTAGQITAMQKPDDTILAHVQIFHVACAEPAERQRWTDTATLNGWPMYPQARETCFPPDRVLLGVAGLKTFNVACPTLALTVADRGRWKTFAENHGWAAYPQAG